MTLARQLTASGQYTATMLSAEARVAFGQDVPTAKADILKFWQTALKFWLPPNFSRPTGLIYPLAVAFPKP